MPTSSLSTIPGRTRVVAVGALAFAAALLAACSSSTSSAPSSGATTSAATTGESTTESVGDSNAEDSDVDPFTANPNGIALTAAGTKLTLGQPATVPISSGPDQGVITLDKFALAQGSDADWTALEGEGYDPGGTTPWYLKLTVTVDSGTDIAFDSVETNLQGVVTGQDPVYGDIGITGAELGKALRTRLRSGGRPAAITGVRIEGLESVTGSPDLAEAAGMGRSGIWLRPRLVGLGEFTWG